MPWARLVIVGDDGDRIELALVSPVNPTWGRWRIWPASSFRPGGPDYRVWLCDMAPALKGLLDLTGLLREVGGQPESGEEALGIQEGVDPGDPVP